MSLFSRRSIYACMDLNTNSNIVVSSNLTLFRSRSEAGSIDFASCKFQYNTEHVFAR